MPRQIPNPRQLRHGMLLDAKRVMDNALPELVEIKQLIPEKLHEDFDRLLERFEDTLCTADVRNLFTEK
jgi:hypothetical protein